MMTTRRAVVAGAILLASCAVLAAPKLSRKPAAAPGGLPRYGMVVYSDLCVHPDSGEFGGQRITLQRFSEVDTVLYEYTAGGLSWPVVASDVTIDPRGRQLYFTVQPPDEDERTISGKLADGGKTLVLDGGYCGDEGGADAAVAGDRLRPQGRRLPRLPGVEAPDKHEEGGEAAPAPYVDPVKTTTAGL